MGGAKITDAYEAAVAFGKGEEAGFTYFFNELYLRLRYHAFKIMNDLPGAEDAVEISFVRIWERYKTFNHPKVIKAWLYTTVRNECLNRLMARSNLRIKQEEYGNCQIDELPPVEESIIRSEVYGQLYRCIENLPEECKKVMTLLFKEGLTAREAAYVLKLKVSTIKNQKSNGLKKIKQMFERGYIKEKEEIKQPSCITVSSSLDELNNDFKSWQEVYRLRNEGLTFHDIRDLMGVPTTTLHRYYANYIKITEGF